MCHSRQDDGLQRRWNEEQRDGKYVTGRRAQSIRTSSPRLDRTMSTASVGTNIEASPSAMNGL